MSRVSYEAIEHALSKAHHSQQKDAIPPDEQIVHPEDTHAIYVFFNIQAVDGEGHAILGLGPKGGPLMTYSYYRNSSALKAPGVMACLKQPQQFAAIQKASGWIIHGNPGNWWNEHVDAALALSCTEGAYKSIRQYADTITKDPGTYDFITHNCLNFVEDALAQGGIVLQTHSGRSVHSIAPRDAFEDASGVEGAHRLGEWKYWFPIAPAPQNGLRVISDIPQK